METNKIKSTSQFEFQVIFKLNEKEARALKAITAYGEKSFLEVFYKYLGKCELEDHEEGVKSLFETIKAELPQHLSLFDDIRKMWRTVKEAVAEKV